MKNCLKKNTISEYFIIHHKLDKELKIDNSVIRNHINNHNKEKNPFLIEWEINIGRIFQLQMEMFDADYNKFTFLKSLNGIVLKPNKIYHKETYLDYENLLDSPDLSMIYHASGDDNLKIKFIRSYGRVNNREYYYDLKVGQLVMFNSDIEHIIFNSREENVLLLTQYQFQSP
jgi:hypothetical protein